MSLFFVGVKFYFINIFFFKLCMRNSKLRFKGIYKVIGFYLLMCFNSLKYKVFVF